MGEEGFCSQVAFSCLVLNINFQTHTLGKGVLAGALLNSLSYRQYINCLASRSYIIMYQGHIDPPKAGRRHATPIQSVQDEMLVVTKNRNECAGGRVW
jgi:hypothetical protein